MNTVTVEEAKARFSDILDRLGPGDEISITSNRIPVAKLVSQRTSSARRVPGACAHMIVSYVEDDEHLKDFEEYL
jgi:prevent-host-death family protein